MTDFDPMTLLTLARFRHLGPHITADDYAAAVLDLNSLIGEDILKGADIKSGTMQRTRGAIHDTKVALDLLSAALKTLSQSEEERENLIFVLAKAIDDSLNLGAFYMAGRTKDDLPPPITAADIARRGGKRSGVKRTAAIEEGWHLHARALAVQIRTETPSLAQKPLVTEIDARWKEEGFKPGPDSLLAFIRTEETEGRIARRKKV